MRRVAWKYNPSRSAGNEMTRYVNTNDGTVTDTTATLGYPYVDESTVTAPEATADVARPTIDRIMGDVGEDVDLAQAALDEENARDEPRATLVRRLEKIIDGAE